jgi:hypothetical protein
MSEFKGNYKGATTLFDLFEDKIGSENCSAVCATPIFLFEGFPLFNRFVVLLQTPPVTAFLKKTT